MKRFTWLPALVVALALGLGALGVGIAPAHAAALDDSYIEVAPTAHLATQDYEDKTPGEIDAETGLLYSAAEDKKIITDETEVIGGEKSLKFNFAGKQDYYEFAAGKFDALGFKQNKSYAVSVKVRPKGVKELFLTVIFDYAHWQESVGGDQTGAAYEYGVKDCTYDEQGNLTSANWREGWHGNKYASTNRSKDIQDGVLTIYFEVTFPDQAFGNTGMPFKVVSDGDCSVVFDDIIVDELPRVTRYYTKRVNETFDGLIGKEGDLWTLTPIWAASESIKETLVTENNPETGLFVIDGTASLGYSFGSGSNLAVGGIRVENTKEENVFVSFDVNVGTVSMLNLYTLTLGTQQYCSVQYRKDGNSWKSEGSVTGLTTSVKREDDDYGTTWSVSFYLPIGTHTDGISINFNVNSDTGNVLVFDNFVLAYEDYAPYVKAAPATMTLADPQDVEIAFDGKGNALTEVKLDGVALTQEEDYTVAENTITLPKRHFTQVKNYTVAITTGGGTSELTVSVKKTAITAITGVTVTPKVYDGTTAATLDFSAARFVGAEDAEVSVSATAAFADAHAGENKAVTVSDIALTAGGDEYELADGLTIEGLTGTISKKSIKVTGGITASDKTYDGTTAVTLDATGATFDAKVGADELTVTVTGAFADKNAGADKAIAIDSFTLGGAAADDYTLTAVEVSDLTASIAKKTITVTADAKEITEGDGEAELTYTAEGLVTGDALTGALAREEGTKAGEYAITQGTLTGGDNYTIAFVGATYTIKAAPKKKGCGDMLAGGAFGLIALLGAGLLALKKH